jgi:hypothetical protein
MVAALAVSTLFPAPAQAWPASLQQALMRDARRLVPRTLARLLGEREQEVLDETRRFPPALGQALAADLSTGILSAGTLAALQAHTGESVRLLRQQRISDGVIALGGSMRIPADLADPILTAGAEGYPAGVAREYYAFIEANLGKLPVTLADPAALKLPLREIPAQWQRLLAQSRPEANVIRRELFRNGRVVDHRAIDFRSHVFGVAQISYSRAVTAIAATWLALWAEARGDLTRQPGARLVAPEDAPPLPPVATLPLPPEAEP